MRPAYVQPFDIPSPIALPPDFPFRRLRDAGLKGLKPKSPSLKPRSESVWGCLSIMPSLKEVSAGSSVGPGIGVRWVSVGGPLGH